MKNKFKNPTDLISYLMSSQVRSNYYYRGISEKNQKYPSIMRKNNKDYIAFEEHILDRLMKYGASSIVSATNAFDFIGLAQHYGLPTRLLDWTSNPLVALFFALYGTEKNDQNELKLLLLPKKYSIPINEPIHSPTVTELELSYRNLILDFKLFIKEINNCDFVPLLQKYTEFELDDENGYLENEYRKVQEKNDNKNMIMININNSNSRVQAQDGLFYLPRELDYAKIEEEYTNSKVIELIIDSKWKEELLSILDCFGVSGYKLFNELSSICGYIVDEVEMMERDLLKGFKTNK